MADKIPTAVPAARAPSGSQSLEDLGQIDYRLNPSAGNADDHNSTGDYDQPIGKDWQQAEPWTDQTWAAYDEETDASRYRGINSPEQQANLHLSPDPQSDSQGWSPDLSSQLAWERQVSGAPPS